jgi:hypothetical protein
MRTFMSSVVYEVRRFGHGKGYAPTEVGVADC